VYRAKDAPTPSETTPIEAKPAQAKPLEGLPILSQRQVADSSPDADPPSGRRVRRDGLYPRQALNRSIRRPGSTTRFSGSPRGRLAKRTP
jgi:hypothetical protein